MPPLRGRAHELLDEAWARGVCYFDVARSYGRAEEFLAEWLNHRDDVQEVVVGSKWGYTYTAGWRVDADVHEVKDHSVATFDRQLDETRRLIGTRLDVYQIHSVTPESSALTDTEPGAVTATLATVGDEPATTPDAVTLAAALHQPWAAIVLSGAATTAQLASNLRAIAVALGPDQLARIADLAEPAGRYWHRRSGLAWM